MFNFKSKKRDKLQNPIAKGLYAWNALHAGSFLLFLETMKDCYKFLFLPGPSEYFLTHEDFQFCVRSGTLEFVEALPDEIFQESLKLSLACPSSISTIISNETSHEKNQNVSQKISNP